ncbi:stage V sporulation protein AA [Clostridium sp. Marseille-P299]|uniref:stage V sporulation protein AA n=1 Tax=Clostridium sp. Marseille-P299 TaxID=1805477 RepID=UPI000831089F|nr:stage V sporulation protein AA [Clostridium sp. Marseille-P299]
MEMQTLYIKAEMCSIVTNRKVFLRDVVKLYGTDKKMVKELNEEVVLVVPNEKKCKFAVSVLKIIEILQKQHPNVLVINVGVIDFVIEYIPPGKKKKALEIAKTIFVCLAVFFGSAFTIMTFNEDVSVEKVFDQFYRLVMGHTKSGGSVLEISYSIGLPIGIIVFFNHFTRIKIDSDPTPLQVQLRLYEQDMNTTVIENASREGKSIDAG